MYSPTFLCIFGSCFVMTVIACAGILMCTIEERRLQSVLLPLVAFSAGSLLAGALLHLLPEAVAARGGGVGTFLPALAGFALFFLMEQFLAWHHGHSPAVTTMQPVTYLILLANGLHNFIGGLAIAASLSSSAPRSASSRGSPPRRTSFRRSWLISPFDSRGLEA